MIWQIARKEFLLNIMTLRFAAAVAVCVGVTLVSAFVLVQDFERRVQNYSRAVQDHREDLGKIVIFSEVKGWADRPPSPLSFLAIGGEWEAGTSVQVDHIDVPTAAAGRHRANPLLGIFADVDPALVVEVLVSLLVLLFAYDAVSGERERGTLSLTFANAVSRAEFLLAKYLGGMATIVVPVLLGLLTAVAVAAGSPWIELGGEAWLRIGLFGLCSLAYVSLVFLLGLVISTWCKRASTSLIVLFFVWIVLVVVIPDGSAYLAARLQPVTSAQVIKMKREGLDGEFWGEMRQYAREHPKPWEFWDWDMIIKDYVYVQSGDLPYAFRCLYAPEEVIDWYRRGTSYGVKLRLRYAERRWDVYRDYLYEQRDQARLAMDIARLSPAWVFGRVADVLAGTDPESDQRFLDQARAYRQELVEYIKNQGGFDSQGYFTRLKGTDLRSFHELKALKEAGGKEAIQELARPWTQNLAPLEGIPEFRYQPEDWSKSLARVGFDMGLLLLVNVMLFLVAHASFLRRDLRQTG